MEWKSGRKGQNSRRRRDRSSILEAGIPELSSRQGSADNLDRWNECRLPRHTDMETNQRRDQELPFLVL